MVPRSTRAHEGGPEREVAWASNDTVPFCARHVRDTMPSRGRDARPAGAVRDREFQGSRSIPRVKAAEAASCAATGDMGDARTLFANQRALAPDQLALTPGRGLDEGLYARSRDEGARSARISRRSQRPAGRHSGLLHRRGDAQREVARAPGEPTLWSLRRHRGRLARSSRAASDRRQSPEQGSRLTTATQQSLGISSARPERDPKKQLEARAGAGSGEVVRWPDDRGTDDRSSTCPFARRISAGAASSTRARCWAESGVQRERSPPPRG